MRFTWDSREIHVRFTCAIRVITPSRPRFHYQVRPTVVVWLEHLSLAQNASENSMEKERHLCLQLSYCSIPLMETFKTHWIYLTITPLSVQTENEIKLRNTETGLGASQEFSFCQSLGTWRIQWRSTISLSVARLLGRFIDVLMIHWSLARSLHGLVDWLIDW